MSNVVEQEPFPFVYKVNKVTRIVDGDTIDVIFDLGFDVMYAGRVRLAGIDTPESRTRDKEEKVFGKLAGAYLSEHIKKAERITIKTEYEDAKGKFGRVLGQVWCDGVNINAKMVNEHYAVRYHGQNKADVEAEHLLNRVKLKEAGIV